MAADCGIAGTTIIVGDTGLIIMDPGQSGMAVGSLRGGPAGAEILGFLRAIGRLPSWPAFRRKLKFSRILVH